MQIIVASLIFILQRRGSMSAPKVKPHPEQESHATLRITTSPRPAVGVAATRLDVKHASETGEPRGPQRGKSKTPPAPRREARGTMRGLVRVRAEHGVACAWGGAVSDWVRARTGGRWQRLVASVFDVSNKPGRSLGYALARSGSFPPDNHRQAGHGDCFSWGPFSGFSLQGGVDAPLTVPAVVVVTGCDGWVISCLYASAVCGPAPTAIVIHWAGCSVTRDVVCLIRHSQRWLGE